MRRFDVSKVLLAVLFPFFTVGLASAVAPNPKLVALVPPTARMVAGMIAPQGGSQPSSFLLITHNNLRDLNDFIALSGVDDTRVLEQIIMVASDHGRAVFAEHSLLASGQFNQAHISRSAFRSGSGANATQYRGIPVLEVQPFARERVSFHDVRWLAMVDSHLALFGTPGIVQQELDRYLARSGVDPSLERRLARLRTNDDTWCLATLPPHDSEIQSAFQMLDSRLAELLRAGDTIQFGIHYGRQVEFEYEVGRASNPNLEAVASSLAPSSTRPNGFPLLPFADLTRVDGGFRGVLKVPKARYETWITEMAARAHLRAAAAGSSNR